MINVCKKRKNKYDFYALKFTGMNNFGNTLIFAIAFTNIKCKASYDYIFKQFLERSKTQLIPVPQLFVLPLD
jgi:hypothetical protein